MNTQLADNLYLERTLLCAYAADEFELQDFRSETVPQIDLDDFISGAEDFFAAAAKQPATAGSPFVAHAGDVTLQEFTATIRITGQRRGAIYVSASRAMLTILLMRMGATDITTATMSEALRSLAQAMADAAVSNLSNELLIWSPTVKVSPVNRIDESLQARPVVAPLHWRKYTTQVVMCIE
jgi:chemotaxis protein CheX